MNKTFNGRKFVASYSGGKDSILAIYRAIKLGMKPVSLFGKKKERCWWMNLLKTDLLQISVS